MENAEKKRQSNRLPHYRQIINNALITDWGRDQGEKIASEISANKSRYIAVEQKTGCDWRWIGALHHMECSGNFSQHLANGDPIDAPTVHVPAGIPAGTWEECAIAALMHSSKGYGRDDRGIDWRENLLVWLWRAEEYNGWGYCFSDQVSPYLWCGTSAYTTGKYTADGHYDPSAISQQVGVFAILAGLGVCKSENPGINISTLKLTGIENLSTSMTKKITITQDTYFKIVPPLRMASALNDGEFVLLKNGEKYDVSQIISENDRSHYHLKLVLPAGTTEGWIYCNHAGLGGKDAAEGLPATYRDKPIEIIDKNNSRQLQEELIRIGLLDPPVDGKWGSLSESAKWAWLRTCGGNLLDWDEESLIRLANHPSANELNFTPSDPNDSECLIATKMIKWMAGKNMSFAVSMGSTALAYNLVYAAGINPDGTLNSDKIDGWNDLRFLITVDQQGVVTKRGCWLATVDAGWYWRGSRRMNRDGALQIDRDKQFLSFSCVGRHGAAQYPALVQVGQVTATRDRLGDGPTSDDLAVSGDWFGSNDHHGYDSVVVGINSAGCFVGKTRAGHEKMMALLKTDRRYRRNNGYAWHRLAISGKNLI